MDTATLIRVVLVGVAGYLLGSANSSLIVGRFYGVDVRDHGSGNAGASNTLRTVGKAAALLVTAGDILKGVISCLIGWIAVGSIEGTGELGLLTGGLAAIIGHNWPLYFGFKGGKGVLTSFAVVLMMDWRAGLLLLGIFIIILALTRYISLGSIIASLMFPVVSLIGPFRQSSIFTVYALILALLIVYRHRSNISRIISGTERKLGSKKQPEDNVKPV